MSNIRYNVIVRDEDDYDHLFFTTSDLNEANNKLDFVVQASSTPSILMSSPEYKSIRIEKSSVLKRVELGNQE